MATSLDDQQQALDDLRRRAIRDLESSNTTDDLEGGEHVTLESVANCQLS